MSASARAYYHPSRAMAAIGTRVAQRKTCGDRRAPAAADMVSATAAPAAMACDVFGVVAVVVSAAALTAVLAHVL